MVRSLPVLAVLVLLSLPGTAQVPRSVPSSLRGSQSLFPVRIGDLWGYIDRTGSLRIPPQFTSALDFGPNNEPAPVQVGEFWGLIDTSGRWVRNPVGSHMLMDLNGDGSIFYHYYDSATRQRRFLDTEGRSTERLKRELTPGFRPDSESVDIPPAVRALTYDEVVAFSPDRFIITRVGQIYSESQIVNREGEYLLSSWMRKGIKTDGGYIVFRALRNDGAALLDSTGRILYDSTWSSIQPASSHLFIVGESKKVGRNNRYTRFGIMSPDGTFLIPPTAKDLLPVAGQDSLFLWTSEDGKKKIITPDGKVILSSGAYSNATSVSAGIIRVESDSWFDYTVIDSTFSGTGASFSSGSDVHNGMFYDYVESGRGKKTMRLRRITGEVLFQTDSLVSGSRIIGPDFGEGMVVVANDQEDYFYDFEGRRVLGPYVRAYGFRDGLAPVRVIDTAGRFRWGYIDPRGESAIPATYDSVSSAGPDLLAVGVWEEDRLRWGYINRSGAWVIEPMYDEARSFRNGLGAVMMRGDSGRVVDMHGCLIMDERIEPLPYWGFIDRTGEIVIPIRFSSVSDFSNGIATAQTRGDSNVSGLIDRQGRWKFDSTRFLWVGPFSDGVAAASNGVHPGSRTTGEIGYIGGDGEWIQPPRYDIGGPFRNGHAVVADPRLTAGYLYITPDGKIIWDSRSPDLPDGTR